MNKVYSIEELNKQIAYEKQVIARTTSWKCKNDHKKHLEKLYKLRGKN